MAELFDKEDIYDKQITPLVEELIEICREHDIPMLASFAYKNTEEDGIMLCSTYINPPHRHTPNLQKGLSVIAPEDEIQRYLEERRRHERN